jgi:hypothetical protein
VYTKVENERVINYGDKIFIKSIAEIIKRGLLPTSSQAKKLIKVFNTVEDAGVIFD